MSGLTAAEAGGAFATFSLLGLDDATLFHITAVTELHLHRSCSAAVLRQMLYLRNTWVVSMTVVLIVQCGIALCLHYLIKAMGLFVRLTM